MRESTLMKNALTLCQSDVFLITEPRSYHTLRILVNDIPEHRRQHMLIFPKERSRDRAAPVYTLKGSEVERQYARNAGRSPSGKVDRLPCFNYKR